MTKEFHLTEKQKLQTHIAASGARHILAYGGGRSGKTFGFCRCIAIRAMSAPGSRHLIARLHHIDVKLSVMLDTFPKMMEVAFPGVGWKTNKADQVFTFENGSEVWFGGLDDKARVDKILGREFATIYVNEASQISYETILTLRTRLAQVCTKVDGSPLAQKLYYDLNPVGRGHWTYQEGIAGVYPDRPNIQIPAGLWGFIQMNPKDNRENLTPEMIAEYEALPELQRMRFSDGEYQNEIPGALWPVARIDATRVLAPPELQRIVIAVDPSGSDGLGGDSQGVIPVGLGINGDAYVLGDLSCKLGPGGWATVVAQAYDRYGADAVIAERNFGGEMVRSTINNENPKIPVRLVTASRGKWIRAEPVAALYETTPARPAKVHHVGRLPELEEQMAMFTTGGFQGVGSPDRTDALVWGISELMLKKHKPATVRIL